MRLRPAGALAALPLALAACGSAAGATRPDPSSPPASAAPAAAAPTFRDAGVLQNSIRQSVNHGMADPSDEHYEPGVRVRSVTCIEQTRTSAACLVKTSDGNSAEISIIISADGQQWISH
jgi:hypothetical protein